MSRLSSNSINRLENCGISTIKLAYKEGSGFAILCAIDPDRVSSGSAPLTDGEGFTKFYSSKLYAVRAIQRARPIFASSALIVLHDYFGGAA